MRVSIDWISPTLDLTREHGLLNRMLLIYEEYLHRDNSEYMLQIKKVAKIIRLFVEDYHEKMEEKYIFPLVIDKYLDVVQILISQHRQGRVLTDIILTSKSHNKIMNAISAFIHMYRAHEVIEDTQIFEYFNSIISDRDKYQIGELFEETEHQLLGMNGYKRVLDQLIQIENSMDYLIIN